MAEEQSKYNMPFEEAQEYISKRGLDIPLNDGDVFHDERELTRTIGNVLKWADENQSKVPLEEIKKAADIAYQNALLRLYALDGAVHYMFIQGMEFQRTKKCPDLEFLTKK